MELRQITPDYFVSPQISPEDMRTLAHNGFVAVICNRPDAEVPAEIGAEKMAAAAYAAGLAFTEIPVTRQTMAPDVIDQQREAAEAASGPVLAYCASGTRSTMIWALGQAGARPVDEILEMARRAGYDLEGLRPALG